MSHATVEEAITFQALNPNSQQGPHPKMSEDIKAEWVAALRSGNYLQGSGALGADYVTDTTPKTKLHCCLGVLCEIGVKRGVIESRPTYGYPGYYSYRFIHPLATDHEWVDVMPSSEIDKWAGVAPGASAALVRMNDSENRSFDEIADWIEVHL